MTKEKEKEKIKKAPVDCEAIRLDSSTTDDFNDTLNNRIDKEL
jgi:hypothetical protein